MPLHTDDDRTSAPGLFHFARSYWQSGVRLHHDKVKVTHPEAPVTLLLAHAFELYLKAFLRLRGLGVKQVKTGYGHDFRKLVEEAEARGLRLDDEDKEVAAILTEQESIISLYRDRLSHSSKSSRSFEHLPEPRRICVSSFSYRRSQGPHHRARPH